MNQPINFIWAGERTKRNTRLKFSINITKDCDLLELYVADFFQVYADGKFLCYGPERTASGYARRAEVKIKGVKNLVVYVNAYNVNCYAYDLQEPFFGARILSGKNEIYRSEDFNCSEENCRIRKVPRHSLQRGFIEVCDYRKVGETKLETYQVPSPTLLNGIGDNASYEKCDFYLHNTFNFNGFNENTTKISWYEKDVWANRDFEYERDFLNKVTSGFTAYDYRLNRERTGFIGLKIKAKEEVEIFIRHEEFLSNDSWNSERTTTCRNLISLTIKEGETEFLSAEPYAFKYLLVLLKGQAEIEPYFVALENKQAKAVKISGNEKFVSVFEAARHTFEQNALDIFMDCPGRERAGWLCDSYFTAFSEKLFTGENKIERAYLENIILANTEELPDGMLPKSFPSEHNNGVYIPNWALWFIVELESYLDRTGDRTLIDSAKEKVYKLLDFFTNYENEFGLLENLESWVFIEWSICNDKNYTSGINFPSNMLYAKALDCVAYLFNDNKQREKAKQIRKTIYDLSYNGEFFIENAVRDENNKIIPCTEHLSETCQYYALFFGIKTDEKFVSMMKNDFGPLRKADCYPNVGKSNMFIGNYLRLFWLCSQGEYDKVILESVEYFSRMASKTGTLWEHDRPGSSCNHGFASVIAVIMLRCLCGYLDVKNGVVEFEKDFKSICEKYNIDVFFNYNNE